MLRIKISKKKTLKKDVLSFILNVATLPTFLMYSGIVSRN